MAFCEQCGTQLSETAKFCSSCGKPLGALASTQAVAPARKRSPRSKTLIGFGVVAIFLISLGVGVAYYLFHRASAKSAESTQGLPDMDSMIKGLSGAGAQAAAPPVSTDTIPGLDSNKVVTPEDGQCALFTKEELSRVLETDFTHADADATGCTYKGDAPRLWVRTEATWKGGRKLVKAKSDGYKALRQSMVSQHYSKADIDSHVFPLSPYPGVGDEAWVDLVNVVTARKGDRGVTMDLRYYHDSDELTKMLTNTALSRLQDKNTTTGARSSPSTP